MVVKLSLPMLADALEQRGVAVERHIGRAAGFSFSRVRALMGNIADFANGCLPIVDGAQGVMDTCGHCAMDFACIGVPNASITRALGESYISIDGSIAVIDALQTIQDVIDKYSAWENDVVSAIVSGEPLQEAFDRACAILANPVAIFDVSSALIMSSGAIPQGETGTVWDTVLAGGYAPVEDTIPLKEGNYLLQPDNASLWRHATIMTNPLDESTPCVAGIVIDGKLFAIMAAVDLNAPFSPGEIGRFELVRDVMQEAFAGSPELRSAGGGGGAFIHQLLDGSVRDERVIAYHLSLRGWRADDPFEVMVVSNRDGAPLTANQQSLCVSRIKRIAPSSIVFARSGQVEVIHRVRDKQKGEQEKGQIIALLAKLELAAGCSEVVDGISEASRADKQARQVLRFIPEDGEIVHFADVWEDLAASLLRDTGEFEVLVHPLARRLSEYDRNAGTSYAQTLRVLLECGLNMSQAAKQLYIHRSTLVYHRERIEQIIGVGLDELSPTERLQLIFSIARKR